MPTDGRANVLLEYPFDLCRPFEFGRRVIQQVSVEELVNGLDFQASGLLCRRVGALCHSRSMTACLGARLVERQSPGIRPM